MQVYENVKVTNLINLDIDVSALYLIAAPKTPEPIREQVLARAANGEHITHREVRTLLLEQTIERGLPTFIEGGEALREIRDRRLYRPEFATFEEYCEQRWGFDSQTLTELLAGFPDAK